MVVDPRHDHILPHPPPRSDGNAGHAERLQRLPHRQDPAMGGGCDRGLVRPRPQGLPDLCCRFPCRPDRRRGCGRDACGASSPTGLRRLRAGGRAARAGAFPLHANVGVAQASLADPDPMVRIGALDMLESCRRRSLADGRAGPDRSRAGCAPPCRQRCSPPSRPPASRRVTATLRARGGRIRRRSAPQCGSARGRLHVGSFFARRGQAAEAERNTRRRSQFRPHFPRPPSISPISTADSVAMVRARPCFGVRLPLPPRMQVRCMRWGWPWYGSNDLMRRSICCAARQRPSPNARDTPTCTRSG